MYLQSHDLFYLFLKRSNFDDERLIFFFLIRFIKKKKRKREKQNSSFSACQVQHSKQVKKQQTTNTSRAQYEAVVLHSFASETAAKSGVLRLVQLMNPHRRVCHRHFKWETTQTTRLYEGGIQGQSEQVWSCLCLSQDKPGKPMTHSTLFS